MQSHKRKYMGNNPSNVVIFAMISAISREIISVFHIVISFNIENLDEF